MNTCVRTLSVFLALSRIPVAGQAIPGVCDEAPDPPLHVFDQKGDVSTEFRVWVDSIGKSSPCPHGASARATSISVGALAHKPSKAARKELDRGLQALRHGSVSEAGERLNEAARLDPADVEIQVQLAKFHAQKGDLPRALESFLAASKLAPNLGELQSNVAWALIDLGHPAEAEPFARRGVQLAPQSIESRWMLGLALVLQGQFTPEAVALLRDAAGKHPQAREALEWVESESQRLETLRWLRLFGPY